MCGIDTSALALISFPLDAVLVSALGLKIYSTSVFVSLFLSALISGHIFARKLREVRREVIAKITVLGAAPMYLVSMIFPAAVADWGPKVKEAYQAEGIKYGTTLSTEEWTNWEMMCLDVTLSLVVVMALVVGFNGVYVGLMFRRPVKSGK